MALVSATPLPAQTAPAPLLPGLVATASDSDRSIVFVTPTANFNLKETQSIHPQLKPSFKVRWDGILFVVRGGKYSFTSDAKLLVAGREVQGQSVQLDPGEHPLRVEYERRPGPARLQFQWESDFFRREPIPAGVLGHRERPAAALAQARADRGRQLVEELNCMACHRTASRVLAGRTGPHLSNVGNRVSAAWTYQWLENPRQFRAAAVMPALLAPAQERADVTAYLATLKDPGGATGPIEMTQDKYNRGRELFDTIGCQGCHGNNQVSLAGLGSKSPVGQVARYLADPLAVDPGGRMPDMAVTPLEAELLEVYLVQSRNEAFERQAPPGNAARGRQLVSARGCVNCHSINDPQGAPPKTLETTPFEKLSAGRGCLAETPPAAAARYGLSREDREAIGAFVQRPDLHEAPVQDFHRAIARFQCTACHELNGPARLTFEANQSPPPLSDAGNKLRAGWLDLVLNRKKRVRPWMNLRMPHYGETNTAPLVDLVAAQAGAEFGEGLKIPPPAKEQVQEGVKLLGSGEGGLSCINCHDFKGGKSGGEMRGPDLTEMYDRIRVDWLHRWLWDPGRIQPGTAMPAFFSDLPVAQSQRMIDALTWALASGRDMPEPAGLREAAAAYVVEVKAEPVLLRTFMPDSSPRSIAVGLPGGQSYCFDAQISALRYVWSGGFLDAKPVWSERGGQPAVVLGRRFYTAPGFCPVRVGSVEADPKPRFRGYRLENQVPVFLYEVAGVPVREKIVSSRSGRGVTREFELGPVKSDVFFVAPESPGVTLSSAPGKLANGRLRLAGGNKVNFSITIEPK